MPEQVDTIGEHVLILDDDLLCASRLGHELRRHGVSVVTAPSVDLVAAVAKDSSVTAIVWGIPRMKPHHEVQLRLLRASGLRMPLLVLLQSASEDERCAILAAGADACALKSLGDAEVSSLVRAAARRRGWESALHFAENTYVLDRELKRVSRCAPESGHWVTLHGKEYELVRLLVENFGSMVPHSQIDLCIWGHEVLAMTRYRLVRRSRARIIPIGLNIINNHAEGYALVPARGTSASAGC